MCAVVVIELCVFSILWEMISLCPRQSRGQDEDRWGPVCTAVTTTASLSYASAHMMCVSVMLCLHV